MSARPYSMTCLGVIEAWARLMDGDADEAVLLAEAQRLGLDLEDARHLLAAWQSAQVEPTALALEPATTTTVPTVGAEE